MNTKWIQLDDIGIIPGNNHLMKKGANNVYKQGRELTKIESALIEEILRARDLAEGPAQANPLTPSLPVLVKLGSLAVHIEEMLSPKGHTFDKKAIESLLMDEDLKAWLKLMGDMAFLPVKR